MFMKLINRLLKYVGFELRGSPHAAARKSFRKLLGFTQGMTSFDEADLLYRLAKQTKEGCIVEVGSYRGRSTVALGRGSLDGHRAPVFAIEPHEEFVGILGGQFGPEDRAAFFRAMLDTACYQIVRLINLSSEVVAPNWSKPIGLLWIDGDHSYEGVKRDWECWAPHLAANATVAFDDSLDQSIGPYKLINELVQAGGYRKTELVGKVTVLKKAPR
jgi:predicted O-methyltransferase YrrM